MTSKKPARPTTIEQAVAEAIAEGHRQAPEYRKAVTLLEDMQSRQRQVQEHVETIVSSINAASSSHHSEELDRQADAWASRQPVLPADDERVRVLSLKLNEARAELTIAERAIARQVNEVNRWWNQWSAVVCKTLQVVHGGLAQRMVAAIRETSAVLEDITQFADTLTMLNVSWTAYLRPLGVFGDSVRVDLDGGEKWRHTTASMYLRDLAEHGLI